MWKDFDGPIVTLRKGQCGVFEGVSSICFAEEEARQDNGRSDGYSWPNMNGSVFDWAAMQDLDYSSGPSVFARPESPFDQYGTGGI